MNKTEKEKFISLIKRYRFRVGKFELIAKDLKKFHNINTEELFREITEWKNNQGF